MAHQIELSKPAILEFDQPQIDRATRDIALPFSRATLTDRCIAMYHAR